jgi:DNA repair exonuclease SbcCD ATPase subunit
MLCTSQQHSQGLEEQIAELLGAQAKLTDTVHEHQEMHASSQRELQGAIQKVRELEQQCASAKKRADEAVEQAHEMQARLEEVQHQQEVCYVCMPTHAPNYHTLFVTYHHTQVVMFPALLNHV